MEMIKCPECGKENESGAINCGGCGYPLKNEMQEKIDYKLVKRNPSKIFRTIKNCMLSVACVLFMISCVFFYKGYDVKNNYYNSEDYSILNQNAYVGGDAYNYIINGTYFTGYSVIASACMICGVVLCTSALNVSIKMYELKEA